MDFLVGVFQNAAWAALVAIATFLTVKFHRWHEFRRFTRVFGRSVKEPSDVSVSVPLWRALENERTTPRFLKRDGENEYEELYGPSEMYNREDMLATAHVLNVIANHFDREVTYKNDAEEIAWNNNTILIVGSSLVNYHGKYFLAKLDNKTKQQIPLFVECEENEETRARCFIVDPRNGREYHSTPTTDYGLVVRAPNIFAYPKNYFIFLIAGIHAGSTREAGRLFNSSWDKLSRGNNSSGFIFEMANGKPGTGHIVSSI